MERNVLDRVMAFSTGGRLDYDVSQTWPDLFLEQVRLHPEHTAVVAENGSLSYGELDQLSERLAGALVKKEGIQPDEFIAVRMGRVKEFHVAVLAIHKAGAAYMPIDLEYPTERVAYMMEDSGARLTLTEQRVAELLREECPIEDLSSRRWPERRAYVIYTSGSTGKPKGVVIPQRALTNFVHFIAKHWGLGTHSRIALHSNFAFDAAVEDLFPALTVGGTVFVVPESARRDIFEMRAFIEKHRINGGSYSTQFGQLLAMDEPLDVDYLCMGGEAMTITPKARGPVYNVYGPTEFTVDATYFELEKGREYDNIPIGRPLDNCAAYIVNERLELLPPGEVGELCLAGPQLAEGYWNRPQLTEQAFTTLKLTDEESVRIYRTGDLARWNDEGQLEFCGRIDTQVKLRGFRIELGEVESRAARYPGIRQTAAEVRKNTLCLYYTASEEIDEAALSTFMAGSLADYMVPGAFMRLDAMPHNVNGKIDRRALPDPVIHGTQEYVAPETDAERDVVNAMAKVLGIDEPLGVTQDFFELGGDSIKAIRLVSALRNLGYACAVADVMEARNARALVLGLSSSAAEAISQEPIEGWVEDTAIFAFFRDLNYPDPAYYNQSTLLTIHGRADLSALQRASDAIVRQHDMLRAVMQNGHLCVRPSSATIGIEEYALEADRAEAIQALCEDIQSHLNIEQSLVRLALIHAGERDLFFLTAHHTIVDGVSWRVWMDDLETAYGQALRGEEIKLPAKTHTYRDYAEAMKAYRSSYALSQELPYWKKVEARMLQLDTSDNKDYTRQFDSLSVAMTEADTDAFLKTRLNVLRLEVNDLLLTALGQGYRQVFGKDAVSVSMEGHGREELGRKLSIDRAIGWFTSVYPVVLEGFTGDAKGDLIRVKETLHAIPNKGVGYNILAFVSGVPETDFQTARAPMVIFNYLGDVSGEGEKGEYFEPDSADGFSAGLDYYDPRNHDGGDLVVNCLVDGGRFTLWLDYNRGRFTEAQARDFAQAILDHITALGGFLNAQSAALAKTASDLGETEWSPEVFENIVAEFAARGETIRRIYPLTPMQEGMLLEHVTHPESRAYRLIDIYECKRPLDEGLLRHAIDVLAERHEVLRTAIIHKGISRFRQAIVDRRLPLTMVDLTSSDDPFAEVRKIRLNLLDNGYDLQDRPLTQFVYCKTAQGGYLIFATHHIIIDGWSFETMLRDLNALLRGEVLTGSSEGQYERAVREQLNRDKKAAVSYFSKLLEGYENSAVIPSWGEVPEAERDADDQISGTLSAKATQKLTALCKSAGATLADGFNLAWGLVLGTLNRTADVVFSAITSGRDGYSADVSDLVGLFINPVPVRINPGKKVSARQALIDLNRQSRQTRPHDFCPLADIQNALGGDIRLDGLIVSFENYSEGGQDKALLKPALIREEHEVGSVDVDATVQSDGSITLLLSYDPAMYRGSDMARLLRLFENCATRMTECPDVPLSTLPLLNDADLQAVLALSKGEEMSYDANQTWIDLFRAQVSRTPDAAAVSDEAGSYTYAELDRASDGVAAALIANGVQENSFVAIRMGREKEFLAAAIGVHKAGAAYVPIDPEYPQERIDYMLDDSGTKVLLTCEDVLKAICDYPNPVPVNRATPKHRAYMIYTSGSTGLPKGVMIPHSALGNFVRFIASRWGLGAHSRVAIHSTFSFDAAVEDLYPALTVGGQVFVVPERARKDIFEMRAYISKNHINSGCYSTQFGQLLGMDAPLDLNYICLGGEAMTTVPQCRGSVYNTYGPTEFTVDATYYELDRGRDYRNIPIGRPLHNCAAYITDAQGRLLPRGMTGELCLSGPQLAEGYWKRPELTEEKFTRLTLPDGQSVRVYKTGDLARWNDEGQLEFYGRIDFQVKLRGFRIELGEIENVCMACPGVSAAVAEVKKSGESQILCLYYTQKDEGVDVKALETQCRQRLADYMVPSVFMRLEEMPLSPSGKVNRRALPMPEIEEKTDIVGPETETERILYGIVFEILGMGGFGVTTSLAEMGLSSISIMRLSAMMEKKLNIHMTVGDIMRQPTIRALAAALDRTEEVDHAWEKREFYPLSKTQTGILVESLSHEGTTVYNIPYLYRLDDRVDMERLNRALEQAVAAHPCLSMTICYNEDGEAMARRNEGCIVGIEQMDRLPAIEALVKPFDLTGGEALCRAALIDGAEGKYLFLDTHHIVSDGESIRILFEDINAAYAGEAIKTEQYSGYEFALDEQAARASERFKEARTWYEGKCRGVESQTLPLREANLNAEGHIATGHTRGRADANAVRAYCEKHGLTLNAFFTTAFGLALKAYTGSESAVFATIYNGRSDSRLARSVSMFVKTLPVVLEISREQGVEEAIKATQNWLLSAMTHDIFSFAEIHEAWGIGSDVLFAYQGEVDHGERLGGYPATEVEMSLSQAKALFGMDVWVDGDAVIYETEYDPAHYGPYTVEGFVRMLDHICGELLVRENVKDVRLIDEMAGQAILALHDTDWPVETRPAYRLLQDSAERCPDRTALVAVDRSMTYEELNSEANAIGHALAERGAGAETIVAVMADRDSWAYVMRQGVLKSGGAFMPIDPEYPEERVRYILEDSGAKLLVTTERIVQRWGELFAELGVEVVRAEEAVTSRSRENLNVPLDWEALCYVIYTSGSTGKPKGVMLTNHNLVNFVDDDVKNREIQGYTKRGRVSLAIAALTFDFSIMEEFVPLANGMTVVLATKEQMMNPGEISELMLQTHVDVMSCTPSYLSNMLAIDAFVPAVKALKSVDFGAEAFPSALFDKLRAVNPDLYIMNGYGPTEATISCTMEALTQGADITIGIPNVNVHVATLDREGRLQPPGAMGEMVILGDGVGRGYVGRDDLTEKSFITLLGKKAYRSGDLVRLRSDGKIEFHGRVDNQVKLRGLRIELGEIENVINAYPGIHTSIAVVNWDRECIVAYFTAEKPVDMDALKAHMASYLTAYMMPAALMQLDEMPLTANGKIDKKALPVQEVARKARIIEAPQTDLQRTLCAIFQKALAIDPVGIHENFFELGGTSLKAATVLMSAMLKELPIVYQDIFNAPTVCGLETIILQKEDRETEKPELESVSERDALAHNRNEYVDEIESGPLGNVLLTGATGFLGVHILVDLLEHTDERIYCLVRSHRLKARQKLSSILYYYFDRSFEEEFDRRIFIVEGDIENAASLEATQKLDYHTVINCAACVKHFADIEFLMRVNLHGVENLTRLCLKKNARLIQISTVSVAGDAIGGLRIEQLLREDRLELGQEVQSNAYVYTKYLAEKHVLKAIEEEGLDAKIIRVGNLSSRVRDGEFQMNFRTNAFMNSLRSYAVLGCYPVGAMSDTEELSNIDETARAVVLLSGTNRAFTVFHAYNVHRIVMGDIIYAMNACGIPVAAVSGEEFSRRLREGLAREDINSYLSTLVDYDLDDDEAREEIPTDNCFTVNALYRLGMRWTITDLSILEKMIEAQKSLGFFECAKE